LGSISINMTSKDLRLLSEGIQATQALTGSQSQSQP